MLTPRPSLQRILDRRPVDVDLSTAHQLGSTLQHRINLTPPSCQTRCTFLLT